MRRLFALSVLIAAVLSLRLRADAPDDQYVNVYHLIQDADDAKASGQSDLARNKYQEAQAILKKLQAVYPDWNKKVIEYRLNYVQEKLGAKESPTAAPLVRPGVAPRLNVAAPRPIEPPPRPKVFSEAEINERDNEIAGLKAAVTRLEADKNILQAKLKEAFVAQPAAVDPKELARAEERIKGLEKEKDLLKVALDQEKNKKPADATPARPAVDVASLEAKLQTQTDTIAALTAEKNVLESRVKSSQQTEAELGRLRGENDGLRKQLAAASVPPSSAAKTASPPDQTVLVSSLQKQVQDQTSTIKSLNDQKKALENRIESTDRELLVAKATIQAAGPAPRTSTDSKKVQSLQTSIKVLEAKNATLERERKELEARLKSTPTPTVAATPAPAAPEPPKRVASLEASVKTLEQQNASLQKERSDLESRLKSTTKPASDNARIKQLEKERDDLLKKLNEAARSNYENKGKKGKEEGSKEVASLRARISALEAEKVPYSPEELAMMRTTAAAAAPKVEPARPTETRKVSKEPPPGSALLLAEAQRAFSAHRLEEAETKYKEILKLDEKNIVTLSSLAAIQLDIGKIDDAEKSLKAALAVDPNDARSLSLLGIIRFHQQKYDDAFDVLSRSAELDTKNPETQNYLGTTLAQKGQRKAAETAFRKSIQIAPNYANAHANLAIFYANEKPPFLELARWHYQKALAAGHPPQPEVEKLIQK